MDRRHVVLAGAVAATLAAGCDNPSEPLFEGFEFLETGPMPVKGHATRAWVLTAETKLPSEAEDSTYGSVLKMDIGISTEGEMDAAVVVRECEDDGAVKTNLSFPRKGDTGPISAEAIEFPGFLADCPVEQPCARTLCVEALNHLDGPLDLWLTLAVTVVSSAHTEDDSARVDVPIVLTFEDIAP
jgi:hypothetical protein